MGDEPNESVGFGRRLATEVREPMKRAFVGKDEIISI